MGMHAAETETPGTANGATVPEPEHAGVGDAKPLGPDAAAEQRGANAVEAFARDHEGLTDEDERDALDFLLSPKPPRLYGVTVDYDTEAGIRPLTFVIRGMDGRRLDAIEQAHISETTGKMDQISAECQIVVEATVALEGSTGRQVKPDSPEFLTVRVPKQDAPGEFEQQTLASPAMALEARFKTQLGLIAGVAARVRAISGYDPRKVANPQRRLASAVGNS